MKIKLTRQRARHGKALVLLCLLLPTLFGIAGLVFDGGLMMCRQRDLQHAVDAAATAAAWQLKMNASTAEAKAAATEVVTTGHGISASLVVNIPPASGPYAGLANHVEVIATAEHDSRFMHVVNAIMEYQVSSRALAGVQDVTAGAAIVVLDPEPAALTVSGISDILVAVNASTLISSAVNQSGVSEIVASVPVIGPAVKNLLSSAMTNVMGEIIDDLWAQTVDCVTLSPLPTLVAGLEVEGLGRLRIDGAIMVNTEWGGEDENGEITGNSPGPPYALACMPVLPTTRISARDVRVVGGVDDRNSYQPFDQGDRSPLQAGRAAVPDPFEDLQVPSVESDPANVSALVKDPTDVVHVVLSTNLAHTLTSGVLAQLTPLLRPLLQPLIAPIEQTLTSRTLQPGVYNSITVLAPFGGVRFEPGVYVIRGTSPASNVSLTIVGPVEAEGVLFYITNSNDFSATTGLPDESDDPSRPPANTLASTLPSTLILPLLSGGRITGLNDAGSPFNGMLIYQRTLDRRPIILEAQQLLGSGVISGTVYSKWGHVTFLGGMGSYDLRFVAGTLRVITATTTTLAPSNLLPAAQDVLLLE